MADTRVSSNLSSKRWCIRVRDVAKMVEVVFDVG